MWSCRRGSARRSGGAGYSVRLLATLRAGQRGLAWMSRTRSPTIFMFGEKAGLFPCLSLSRDCASLVASALGDSMQFARDFRVTIEQRQYLVCLRRRQPENQMTEAHVRQLLHDILLRWRLE